ncbi:hypothetical protein P8452_28945 [Trifolium repens]|nr:hypothetical protein P8452_28945 [Trifolium repens]
MYMATMVLHGLRVAASPFHIHLVPSLGEVSACSSQQPAVLPVLCPGEVPACSSQQPVVLPVLYPGEVHVAFCVQSSAAVCSVPANSLQQPAVLPALSPGEVPVASCVQSSAAAYLAA